MKPLPNNLKYVYLEEENKLPVIISTSLTAEQEQRLLDVLKKHKKAIGWTLADIPGISPSTCMHKILLEDGAKPVRQPQRRLNHVISDVVKKEVTKLLQAGIIYPIFDSQWVSPIHVVPKNTGLTVVKNEKEELIPIRVQNSWRVCIDYRRLNQETRKDHFACLLLIRCLSAWLVSHTIAFLMVFLVTFKFTLHLKTKRKSYSPGPLALLPIGGCRLAYAMPLAHSSGACLAFSVIFLKNA